MDEVLEFSKVMSSDEGKFAVIEARTIPQAEKIKEIYENFEVKIQKITSEIRGDDVLVCFLTDGVENTYIVDAYGRVVSLFIGTMAFYF